MRRASARGLWAPSSEDVERVFIGDAGYACALLTRKSKARADLISQFTNAWRSGNAPRVERVYEVRPSPILVESHKRYAKLVGNVRRRFHGTRAACSFGVDLGAAPCDDSRCALCSILSTSFSIRHAGTGPNAARVAFGAAAGLRYGRGLYFSATSSKSNDYAAGSERILHGRRWRTLFVASVAAGKAYCTYDKELDLTKPPDGYDSVVGEVGPHLNYDELVVYDQDAALPSFLLVLSMPMG